MRQFRNRVSSEEKMRKLVQYHKPLDLSRMPALTDKKLLLTGLLAIVAACGLALFIFR